MWQECFARAESNGPYLFGHPTAADAASAPLVSIFDTYQFEIDARSQEYIETIKNNSLYREWLDDAKKEAWVNPEYELIGLNQRAIQP